MECPGWPLDEATMRAGNHIIGARLGWGGDLMTASVDPKAFLLVGVVFVVLWSEE